RAASCVGARPAARTRLPRRHRLARFGNFSRTRHTASLDCGDPSVPRRSPGRATIRFLCLSALTACAAIALAHGEAFEIREFVVEGNSVLSAVQIERAVQPLLGPEGGIERVEKARAQLERAYHDAGYLTVIVDIPEQQVRNGVVRLRVTEGRVERVRVQG